MSSVLRSAFLLLMPLFWLALSVTGMTGMPGNTAGARTVTIGEAAFVVVTASLPIPFPPQEVDLSLHIGDDGSELPRSWRNPDGSALWPGQYQRSQNRFLGRTESLSGSLRWSPSIYIAQRRLLI